MSLLRKKRFATRKTSRKRVCVDKREKIDKNEKINFENVNANTDKNEIEISLNK